MGVVTVGHHAIHILAALAVLMGLFAGSWALERRPLPARPDAEPASRGAWERRLSGMGLGGPRRPVRPIALHVPRAEPAGTTAVVIRWAAALSLFAGAIHFAALPEHLRESGLFAAFFFGCGTFQAATGLALRVHATRRLSLLVAIANAAVVALWVLSRTRGVPLGPAPWVPEHVGALDTVASACEVALIGLAALLYRRAGREAVTR